MGYFSLETLPTVSGRKLYVSDPNHIGGKTMIMFKGKKLVVDVPENGTTSKGMPFDMGI